MVRFVNSAAVRVLENNMQKGDEQNAFSILQPFVSRLWYHHQLRKASLVQTNQSSQWLRCPQWQKRVSVWNVRWCFHWSCLLIKILSEILLLPLVGFEESKVYFPYSMSNMSFCLSLDWNWRHQYTKYLVVLRF